MQVAPTHREYPWRVRLAPTPRKMMAIGAMSALLLSGCGGGRSGSSDEGSASGAVTAQDSLQLDQAKGANPVPGASGRQSDVAKAGTPVVSIGPQLAKSASIDLRVKDIGTAAARVRSIAAGLQALVLSEQIGKGGPGGPRPLQDNVKPSSDFGGFGTLTLSVPADKLDTALDQLAVGVTVLQRTTSSQDVTSQYVDTQSRLKTMRASVQRVRALMAQAKDLGQVVALEGEVSRREADLESLQSQLDALDTSVKRSTLAVSLITQDASNAPATNGFFAGLRSGWDAFTASAAELLQVIGAVLPFALFLALLGAPLWTWWRRRRLANHPPVVPAPAA